MRNASGVQQAVHVAEIPFDQGQPSGKTPHQRGAEGQRVGIAVDPPDPTVSRAQQRLAIAAGAECPVDIPAAGFGAQRRDDGIAQDRDMGGAGHSAPAGRTGKGTAPSLIASIDSTRRRSSACGSQIWKVAPRPRKAASVVIPT